MPFCVSCAFHVLLLLPFLCNPRGSNMGQSWRQKLTFFGSSSLWNLQETTFHTPPLGDGEHVIKEGTDTIPDFSGITLICHAFDRSRLWNNSNKRTNYTTTATICFISLSWASPFYIYSHRRPGDELLDGGRLEVDFVQ